MLCTTKMLTFLNILYLFKRMGKYKNFQFQALESNQGHHFVTSAYEEKSKMEDGGKSLRKTTKKVTNLVWILIYYLCKYELNELLNWGKTSRSCVWVPQ